MYCLEVIHKLNKPSNRKPETEWSRHCSFHGTREKGLVLHSAKLRSTAFLNPGPDAVQFLVKWHATNSAVKRDSLVESYF